MERKIQWNSGCFDEIELVYDKAAEKEITTKLLAELEKGALDEAKAHRGLIQQQDNSIDLEKYDKLPDYVKESLMAMLSEMGLIYFSAPLTEPKIIVKLSSQIQQVRCCTAFSILNRIEKLDGALNVLHPEVTLEIHAPLGGKKGLSQIEMLIVLLYPWVRVTEVSSNEIAADLPQVQSEVPQKTSGKQDKQMGFWERLFGKKK